MNEPIPGTFVAFLMQIPLTIGLPQTPSNLINKTSSIPTETLTSTTCNGLLAPTMEYISISNKTCTFFIQNKEFIPQKRNNYKMNQSIDNHTIF